MSASGRSAPAILGRGLGGVRVARLRAAAPRYLVSVAALLLVVVGLRTLLASPPVPSVAVAPRGADAPSQDFALQFARAYLTFDARWPSLRTRALAPFLAGRLDADAGVSVSRGSQEVDWAEVASDQPALTGGRVITVAAQVSTQRLPVYLAVTVVHDRGGLALAGYPAFVGAPTLAAEVPEQARPVADDPAVTSVVERVISNYLAGSVPNLEADLASDAEVTLPTVAVRVRSVDRIEWLGDVGSGAVLTTVTAIGRDGATYTLAYELGIAYRERPYVDFIAVVPTAG